MLAWLDPIALAGLAAAAGPIAVHLLRRQRASRLPFPSLRFVRAASTAAVRLRAPSDLRLLLLRIAIVCGAAVALAQPFVITPARRSAWDGRVSRAVVVDVSPSMAAAGARVEEAAAAESRGAAYTMRVEVERLRDGLVRAAEGLETQPPSRREIVVLSDFLVGSLSATDLATVPPGIGLRFVNLGVARPAGEFSGDVTLGAPGIEPRLQHVRLDASGTVLRLPIAPALTGGVRFADAGASTDALLRAVARAGAPAPSAGRPLTLLFTASSTRSSAPTTARPDGSNATDAANLRTLIALRRDRSLADAAREHRRQGTVPGPPWVAIARDAGGTPVLAARASGNELVLQIAGTPADYLAAATLRSALVARRGESAWQEHEIEPIPSVQLAAWSRKAAPVDPSAFPDASDGAPGDARWIWLAVLALLGLESAARRPARPREEDVHARVA